MDETINGNDLNQKLIESLDLRDRVAIVTGGSRGIGRAAIDCFASLGAHVVVNYVSDAAAAAETVRRAEAAGVRAIAIRADVAQLDEAQKLVDEAIKVFGRLDFLVCNAGIWEAALVEEMTEELWDRTLDLNLKGTWAVCRAAVPHMKEKKFGRIVIISSTAGQRGEAGVSNYAASKGGQISFTKSLAPELAAFGINVNCVAPGWVATDMCADVFSDEPYRKSIEATIPLGRIATAHDIGWPIAFLCSSWARHITGEILNVNGGAVLCG
jgi:3-oxoacyl-[acyl-carrier protein] reductase